jgi:hypothetical protein
MKIVKAFNPDQSPAARYLAAAALAVSLAGASAPLSAVMIDDFSVSQTKITDTTAGASPVTSTAAGAGIIGGTRFLSINLAAAGVGEETSAQVIGGHYSNSYDTTAYGQSRIVWSGAANDTALALGANLCAGSKFAVDFQSNDHAVNYKLKVYTTNADWSQATFAVPGTVIPPGVIYNVPFASFALGGGAGANFCSVGRIEMAWDTVADNQPALDMSLDQIEVPNDIAYQCDNKLFNGVSTYVFPTGTVFPQNVTAKVKFSNTGSVAIAAGAMTVKDTMQAGLSYVAGTTNQISAGGPYIAGDPGIVGQVLTWTNAAAIPAGTTVEFQYTVKVNALALGQTLSNQVEVSVSGLTPSSPPACSARVSREPPNVPAMGPLGTLFTALLLGLAGFFAYRRGSAQG